jgi:hypothetical protein
MCFQKHALQIALATASALMVLVNARVNGLVSTATSFPAQTTATTTVPAKTESASAKLATRASHATLSLAPMIAQIMVLAMPSNNASVKTDLLASIAP